MPLLTMAAAAADVVTKAEVSANAWARYLNDRDVTRRKQREVERCRRTQGAFKRVRC